MCLPAGSAVSSGATRAWPGAPHAPLRSARPIECVIKGFLTVYLHADRVCSSPALGIKIDLEKYGQ